MGFGKIKIVVRAVEIGGHERNEVRAILLVVGLAHIYPRNLCQRVRFISRLQVLTLIDTLL